MLRRDLGGEKPEILLPLFGSQSRKRGLTTSKGGSKEEKPEQIFHGSTLYNGAVVSLAPPVGGQRQGFYGIPGLRRDYRQQCLVSLELSPIDRLV